MFELATALLPSHADAYYNAGLAPQQAHIDDPERSIAAYRHALALAPRDAKVWSRLATTLSWSAREAEARQVIAEAIGLGIWSSYWQRPSVLTPGLLAEPWHDERRYSKLEALLRDGHDALYEAWGYLSRSGRMSPQPEGLQERGQEWLVFDLSAECERLEAPAARAPYGGPDSREGRISKRAEDGVEEVGLDVLGAATIGVGTTVAAAAADAADAADAEEGTFTQLEGERALWPACRVLARLHTAGQHARPPFAPLRAQISHMAPGVHVRVHTGPTNAKLTIHYGLAVPHNAAHIRVGADDLRPFLERALIVFDDSFEHEVWQNGTTGRTTLVLHVAHPGLQAGDFSTAVHTSAGQARVQ